METIEIRCPIGPKRLFAKVISEGGRPTITQGNLFEFSCDDCKRALRKRGDNIFRVLHRYDLGGEYVESEVLRDEE